MNSIVRRRPNRKRSWGRIVRLSVLAALALSVQYAAGAEDEDQPPDVPVVPVTAPRIDDPATFCENPENMDSTFCQDYFNSGPANGGGNGGGRQQDGDDDGRDLAAEQANCEANGGTWHASDAACEYPREPDDQPEDQEEDETETDPTLREADDCIARGGTWTGSFCNEPMDTEETLGTCDCNSPEERYTDTTYPQCMAIAAAGRTDSLGFVCHWP